MFNDFPCSMGNTMYCIDSDLVARLQFSVRKLALAQSSKATRFTAGLREIVTRLHGPLNFYWTGSVNVTF